LEENPKQLDQNEIIEILDQDKSPEWHAAMVAANIDIFSMSHEENQLHCTMPPIRPVEVS
jgi:hypothetical protein